LIKDYDLTINYTPVEANVVADALSRKSTDTQPMNRELPKELLMDLERLEIQCLEVQSLGSLATEDEDAFIAKKSTGLRKVDHQNSI
jgi:hypothetical protein